MDPGLWSWSHSPNLTLRREREREDQDQEFSRAALEYWLIFEFNLFVMSTYIQHLSSMLLANTVLCWIRNYWSFTTIITTID